MQKHIDMQITRKDAAIYMVLATITDEEGTAKEYSRTYENSNSIYPMYRTLKVLLSGYKGCTVTITTNSKQFNEELASLSYINGTLANMLSDTITRNEITLIQA